MPNLATASPRWNSLSADSVKALQRTGTASGAWPVQGHFETLRGVGEHSAHEMVWRAPSHSLEERLFDALAAAKITTATFAMHLPRPWRNRFFERLDTMHDVADWEDDDCLLDDQSVRSFLRAWLFLKPSINPGFGISTRGNIIAAWAKGEARLTLEFYARDLVSWLVTIPRRNEDWVERGAGLNKLHEISRVLSPYGAIEWMYGETKDHAAP